MPAGPDFALYPPTRTRIPVLVGRVDGYPTEEHRLDVGTTENPVESGNTLTDNAVVRQTRLKLEGWVSDLLPAEGNDATPDRATDVWGAVIELHRGRTPIRVVTMLREYRQMLIVRAVAPVDARSGRALKFTIDLEEVLFSSTALARFPPDQVTGPASDRTTEVDGGDRESSFARFVPRILN